MNQELATTQDDAMTPVLDSVERMAEGVHLFINQKTKITPVCTTIDETYL
jgi:hypothetical protein